jgi:Arc/MetJ-type ribon-helix-helix transcriptional regulator
MTVKIAVSLPDHLVARAKRAVAQGDAESVSAYVATALERQAKAETLTALLDDLDAIHGAPTDEDFAWADRALGLT